ncbi:CPBP family intramembrane metalloprotease [Halobacteria archaeon AArc-m2/3/4]|uniref:CPBP family intramembrane metalloprotease n=1 Tax=Natronoglomus mannanivorans TaxID=2979990 RepID=A0AAP2Z015_9EURY|nr:CPBP family intramembrane metalloprotease [Halobacteria archaeon AArc-xg1-1]MCU4975102.1 CPBP family intramembrane metalloprotease [Halobacteria archaeon AArc-m2/3/4]
MTQWATFAGLSGVVCVLLLVLSHATKTTLTEPATVSGSDSSSGSGSSSNLGANTSETETADDQSSVSSTPSSSATTDLESSPPFSSDQRDEPESQPGAGSESANADANTNTNANTDPKSETPPESTTENPIEPRAGPGHGSGEPLMESMSAGALLANVALSQGLFAAILIAAAFYTEIPASALGIEFTGAYVFYGLTVGTAVGLGLYVANELGSVTAKRLEIDHSEDLREMLAPESAGGWLILLLVVLPIIAVFEEFLFRAALIGAVSAGFDVSPWLLAVVSSVAFALGHGMQGTAGIVVTGLLGFVLAAAFVVTGSFLVVVVAHYLINALEFVVHEGFGFEWGESGGEPETGTGVGE